MIWSGLDLVMFGNEKDYVDDARRVQARPEGPCGQRQHRLLDVAGRRRSGLPVAADLSVRHGRSPAACRSPSRRSAATSTTKATSDPPTATRARSTRNRPAPLQQRRRRRGAQAPGRRRAGRRPDLRGDQGRRAEQRRLATRQLRRAGCRGPVRSDRHGARAGGRRSRNHHLRRSARHGDAARRPDRSGGADQGVPPRHGRQDSSARSAR